MGNEDFNSNRDKNLLFIHLFIFFCLGGRGESLKENVKDQNLFWAPKIGVTIY